MKGIRMSNRRKNHILTALGKGQAQVLLKQRITTVILLVAIYIIMNVISQGRFITKSNMLAVLSNSVVNAFVVLGFCFIFSMGIIDLSIGAIMILAGNIGGILAVNIGLGYAGLIIGCIASAVVLEVLNLKLVLVTKIPAWIFGLGIAMVYEAIGSIYNVSQIAKGLQVVSLQNSYRGLGEAPANIIVLFIGIIAAYLIFNHSKVGLGLRAVGSNKEVAGMMGINISGSIIQAGLVGGIFLGVASAVNQSYAGRVVPTTGLNSIATIFIPLAAYLLAITLSKVFNLTIAAAISSFIITSIFNVLTIMGVPSGTWQKVIMGASVVICGILSKRSEKGVVK